MPPKHRLKRRRAKSSTRRRRTEHTASRRRTVEVVDAHTFIAHFLTMDALAAGRLPQGRYIALCGQDVLPASLVEPGMSRCASCVAVPVQSQGARA